MGKMHVTKVKYTSFQKRLVFLHSKSEKETSNSCLYLHQILTDFKNSFTDTLSKKFFIKQSLKLPPHLKPVATLPYELLKSEKYCVLYIGELSCFLTRCIWWILMVSQAQPAAAHKSRWDWILASYPISITIFSFPVDFLTVLLKEL